MGLDQNCISCHEDVHQGTLDNNCSKCHTMNKFSPAEKFNHSKTKFELTGKHKEVKCIKCHKNKENTKEELKIFNGLKFNNCSSCHQDIHKGKLGGDCKSCHNTQSFRKINSIKNFNHDRTNFPLIGKHKKVSCKKCHKNTFSRKPNHKKCLDCHSDYHKGEFSKNSKITDCKECHNKNGFTPSLFTLEKHNKTGFPLTGAHKATACISCHLKTKRWQFKIKGNKCTNCHTDIHENSINKKFFINNKCTNCHTTKSWKKVEFDHNKTKFELLGKHKTISCSDCHFPNSKVGDKYKKFVSLNSNCTSCHNDIHRGQFIEGTNELCKNCHTNNDWNPSLFEHDNTEFKLDGAHKNVDCLECHKTITDKKGSYVYYKIKDTRCISCH